MSQESWQNTYDRFRFIILGYFKLSRKHSNGHKQRNLFGISRLETRSGGCLVRHATRSARQATFPALYFTFECNFLRGV